MIITITISTEEKLIHKITTKLTQATQTDVCIQTPAENTPPAFATYLREQLQPALEALGCRIVTPEQAFSHGYLVYIGYAYGPELKSTGLSRHKGKTLICLNTEFDDGYPYQGLSRCALPIGAEVLTYHGLENLHRLTESIIDTLSRWQR